MSKTSVLLMGSSDGKWNFTGDKIRCDGYWSSGVSCNHTVVFFLQNFTGRIWIEGSLAAEPTHEDWFPIWLGSHPYAEFPQIPVRSLTQAAIGASAGEQIGDTGAFPYNFEANLIWVRARLDRGHIAPRPNIESDLYDGVTNIYGIIKKILFN